MKSLSYLLLTFSAMTLACTSQRPDYPETRKTDVTDDYFGTLVPDPYRWLEDDRSEETTEWVKAENKVTSAYLDKIPFREDIRKRLTEIWNYPRESAPWYDGGFYFYTRNDGLQNQSVYYMMKDLDAEPREFLDPNAFSEDGTVALTAFNVSRDGKFLGYGISRGGSDWQEFKVRDMQSGEDLADDLRWIKFSDIAWEGDGFYYSRYPEPSSGDELKGENTNHRLYYHRAGTSQEQDLLVYEDPEHPDRNYYPTVTEDEKFLVLTVAESTSGNALYFENLEKKDAGMVQLVQDFRNDYFFMDNLGNDLLVVTNDGAPNYCLLRIPADLPERENWKVMIPEKSDRVLQNIAMAGNKMLVTYLKDARSLVEVYDQDGNFLYDLDLPGIGTVGSIHARKESNIAFYTFTSFTYPSVVFKYNTEDNCSELYRKSEVDFNPDDYITEQVFYESKDGTKVPMFIVHRQDVQLDGSNPALLYGYGGFNISLTPSFSVSRLVWLEQGGIYAVANIRGGGEYGKEWHDAGTLMNKQNVFDDFIAAAHYLIDNE